ncbi:DUF6331 family protein [Promicromonospora sp. NPDC023987]|uniref:DUF6331 family protein n=1 Tax=Promicromonospora sp. NPDC023987 TaxID=3155360 RepID=UPI003409D0AB
MSTPVDALVEIQDPLRRCFLRFETDCVRACCGIAAIDVDVAGVAGVAEWACTLAPQDLAAAAAQLEDLLTLVADRSRVVTSIFLNHSTVDDGARSELLSLLTIINDGFTAARRAPDEVAKDEL